MSLFLHKKYNYFFNLQVLIFFILLFNVIRIILIMVNSIIGIIAYNNLCLNSIIIKQTKQIVNIICNITIDITIFFIYANVSVLFQILKF